ncbi:MAG TPA: ATP-binding protein, partial [Chloroflexota bacterium]|nr:ATP-binding protein [Chloroflexota bacterium]
MADELSDMFGLAAKDKGVQLRVECAGDTPRHVRADAVKLRQVLVNLLGNALKFTTHGSVSLRIGAIRPSPSSGMDTPRLSFAVVDTGAGISPSELKQLGHAFVQAQAGRQSQEGTGLGLAISRSFVELMGGSLRISSQLGQGTTVEFDIPAQSLAQGEAGPAAAPMRQVIGLAPEQVGFRILVVDDRTESRQLLSRLLGPLGFEVREAGDGAQAVEVAAEWQPQLIFMDIRMPVMDGREAARRIKASEKGSTTIIVALTASSLEDEHAEIMAAGCDAFLRKPFREEELFATLHRCLGVEFVYDDESTSAPAAAMQETPDRHRLAALPAGLQAQLERALGRLDVNEVQAAIADIRRRDATLAAWLGQWAARFQYQRILSFLHDQGEADA